jgi:hypothetical protein
MWCHEVWRWVQHFRRTCCLHLLNESSIFLSNKGTHIPDYTAPHPLTLSFQWRKLSPADNMIYCTVSEISNWNSYLTGDICLTHCNQHRTVALLMIILRKFFINIEWTNWQLLECENCLCPHKKEINPHTPPNHLSERSELPIYFHVVYFCCIQSLTYTYLPAVPIWEQQMAGVLYFPVSKVFIN